MSTEILDLQEPLEWVDVARNINVLLTLLLTHDVINVLETRREFYTEPYNPPSPCGPMLGRVTQPS